MKRIFNSIGIFTLISILSLFPIGALAQGIEQSWGGLHLVTLDESVCTCGGNSNWILDYKTNSLILLYYQAGASRLFTNYNTRATFQLGTYSFGGQPCSILVGTACVSIVNQGTYGMFPGTGTSLTKANSKSALALFQAYEPTAPLQRSYLSSIKNTSKGIFKYPQF